MTQLDMGLTTLENNLFLILFLAAAVHSVFLCLILCVKSQKEQGLELLGLLMIPIALWLMTYLFHLTGLIISYPHLLGIFGPILYVVGPLYYFFIRRSTHPAHRFRWYHLLHLLPAFYVLWETWPIYVTWTVEAKLAAIKHMHSGADPSIWQVLKASRMTLLILAYVLGAYLHLKKHAVQGSTNPRRIHWLLRFTQLFGAMLLLFICMPFLFWKLELTNAAFFELLLVMILAVSIHVLGYIILRKETVLPELVPPIKYATSPLSIDEITAKKKAIVQYLETKQPWMDSQFSMSALSSELNIPKHHISRILSEGFQQSFYELICQYRVDEIKRRLQAGDAQRFSLMGIARDCGFGNKSSFNRAFKKITGMTPTEWLKTSP